jgi:hypothetical protein
MKIILSILYILLVLLPYSVCFYEKMSIQIRLLFVSLFEIFFLVIASTIVLSAKIDSQIASMFFYNMAVCLSVLFNLFLILIIWIIKKRKI